MDEDKDNVIMKAIERLLEPFFISAITKLGEAQRSKSGVELDVLEVQAVAHSLHQMAVTVIVDTMRERIDSTIQEILDTD